MIVMERTGGHELRGKNPDVRVGSFAVWLFTNRERRGLTMTALAERAGISHPRISQLEKGGSPSRDMVKRLAIALAPETMDEGLIASLLDEGLVAAGFMPDRDEYEIVRRDNDVTYEPDPDAQEVMMYYEGTPPYLKPAAKAALKAIFDASRKEDNKDTIGKRAE